MAETFRRFDAAEHLETEEDFAILIEDAVESGDPRVMVNALAVIARSRGMTLLAEQTGISREGLYKAFSNVGNPSFANVGKIADAMGYRVMLVPKVAATKRARSRPSPMTVIAKAMKRRAEARTTKPEPAKPAVAKKAVTMKRGGPKATSLANA